MISISQKKKLRNTESQIVCPRSLVELGFKSQPVWHQSETPNYLITLLPTYLRINK